MKSLIVLLYLSSLAATGMGGMLYAKCTVKPDSKIPAAFSQSISGNVYWSQDTDYPITRMQFDLKGFSTTDGINRHGLHVHALPVNFDAPNGCYSSTGHFDTKDAERVVGDLRDLYEDSDGNVKQEMFDHLISLSGSRNVIGRTLAIHARGDDRLVKGKAPGPILGCCLIEKSNSGTKAGPAGLLFIVLTCAVAYLQK